MSTRTYFKELTEFIFAGCVCYKNEVEEIEKKCADRIEYVKKTYRHDSPERKEEMEKARQKADAEITKAGAEIAKVVIEQSEKIKEVEMEKMANIDTTRLNKIQAISNLPLTAAEIRALNENFGVGNYWCSRAIGELAEKNAVSLAEVNIVPSFDVKMNILNQCINNFNRFIMGFTPTLNGRMKSTEQIELEVGVSADVLNRAYKMYAGDYTGESTADIISKSLMNLATKKTDVEKGIVISNILNNVKNNKEAHDKLLCEISLDDNISDLAIEMSGYQDEIKYFKAGKAEEYKKAEGVVDSIRKSKDETFIDMQIRSNQDNEFFAGMMVDESRRNNVVKEIWAKHTITEAE